MSFVDDVHAQGEALEATIAGLSPAALAAITPPERIVLTGMGASLAALVPLQLRLVAHGFTALVVDTAELVHAMPALVESGLVVALSQSGKSAEIVRLTAMPERRATLVGVTNDPASPLGSAADAVVALRAGAETSVSCKTYVASLAALTLVGDVFCGDQQTATLTAAPLRAYLASFERHLEELEPLVEGVRDLFFAGRGASVAAALTAGLIVKEAARVHAEGMTSAALRHGPIEMMSDRVLALIYEGDAAVAGLNRRLVTDLGRAGARAHLCGPSTPPGVWQLPPAPPAMRAILEILPAQLLAIALARAAGVEPGLFVHTAKITATE